MDFSGDFSWSSQSFLRGRKTENSRLKGVIGGGAGSKNEVLGRGAES